MANSINPFNNAKDAIDQLRAKFKSHKEGVSPESAKKAADGEASAETEAQGKSASQQVKDVFEKSGFNDLFKRSSNNNSTYGPGGTLKTLFGDKGASSANEPASFDNLLKKFGIDPAAFAKYTNPSSATETKDVAKTDETADTANTNNVANTAAADKANASPSSYGSYQYARVQYELNISVMQQMTNGNETYTQAMNFSLKFDYEWMSASTGASSGGKSSNPLGIQSGDDANSIMKKLQDYFSPESTAGRILDFAKGFYPSSKFAKEGDTEESRQKFSDYIGAAIQKGFDQAMGTLGKVDRKTQEGIDKTHTLVFDGLKDFVKNGMGTSTDAQRAYNTESWRMSLEMSYTSIYTRKTTQEDLNKVNTTSAPITNPAAATTDTEA